MLNAKCLAGASVAVLAVLFTGCSSSRRGGAFGDGQPPAALAPDFLTGAMGLLLTNADGFSAQVIEESRGSSNAKKTVTGELFSRGSKILFASNESVSGSRRHPATALSFIWDVRDEGGFVVSEALQGYAPIGSATRFTNMVFAGTGNNAAAAARTALESQPEEVVITSDAGQISRLRIWRTPNGKGAPARIESAQDPPGVILRFSKVLPGPSPAELFVPPEGFTKYNTPVDMMYELMSRQQNQKPKGRVFTEEGEGGRGGGPGRMGGVGGAGP